MAETEWIAIEVAYARADEQFVVALRVPFGTTLAEAVATSRIQISCPEIDLAVNRVGVFGQIRDLSTPLRAGDRVEIYRPLRIDPKTARRRRAKRASSNGERRRGRGHDQG